MGKWMDKLIDKNTCSCFYCENKFDKKNSFKLKVETNEGLINYDVCPSCAKEFNEILKTIEDLKNDYPD
jgi:hypothetical protein